MMIKATTTEGRGRRWSVLVFILLKDRGLNAFSSFLKPAPDPESLFSRQLKFWSEVHSEMATSTMEEVEERFGEWAHEWEKIWEDYQNDRYDYGSGGGG